MPFYSPKRTRAHLVDSVFLALLVKCRVQVVEQLHNLHRTDGVADASETNNVAKEDRHRLVHLEGERRGRISLTENGRKCIEVIVCKNPILFKKTKFSSQAFLVCNLLVCYFINKNSNMI